MSPEPKSLKGSISLGQPVGTCHLPSMGCLQEVAEVNQKWQLTPCHSSSAVPTAQVSVDLRMDGQGVGTRARRSPRRENRRAGSAALQP